MDEKLQYRRRIIILSITASVIVLMGVIAIVLLLSNNGKKQKYYETTKKAESYIIEEDYAKAIAEYQKALKLNDEDAELYEKLSVLYEQTGDINKAKETASTGYKKTRDDILSKMVGNINAYGSTGYTISSNNRLIISTADMLASDKKGDIVSFRRTVSSDLMERNYSDYRSSFGEGAISQDDTNTIVDFGSIILYYPLSLSTLDQIESYEYVPEAVSYPDVTYIFDGTEGTETISYEEVCSAFDSSVEKKTDGDGMHYVHTIYLGLDICIESDIDGNIIKRDPWNRFTILYSTNVEEDDSETSIDMDDNSAILGSASGRIKDATTGQGVSKAHLTIRAGSNNKVGASVLECDTDSFGNYYAELEEGNYCIQVSLNGYIDQFENVTIMRNVDRTGVDIVVSTEVTGEIRIVLEWESAPRDLDSYLTGTSDSGANVNVSFKNMSSYDSSGKCVAELDKDDVDGNGPETITLHDINGKYEFHVEDYTGSGTMAQTNVRVTIYLPDNSSQTVTINSGIGETNYWNVLSIDHGSVRIINQ